MPNFNVGGVVFNTAAAPAAIVAPSANPWRNWGRWPARELAPWATTAGASGCQPSFSASIRSAPTVGARRSTGAASFYSANEQ